MERNKGSSYSIPNTQNNDELEDSDNENEIGLEVDARLKKRLQSPIAPMNILKF